MRLRFFDWLAKTLAKRYVLIFTICMIMTVVFGYFAASIKLETTWGTLVPDGHPSKQTFNEVIDTFGAATMIIAAIEGENKEDLINAAEQLAPELRELKVDVADENNPKIITTINALKRVQTQYDTSYVAQHGLMMVKAKDLRTQYKLYTDYNLPEYLTHVNDVLENDYVQNSDNLTKQEKEAVRSLDGFYEFIESLTPDSNSELESKVSKAVNSMTIGDGYYLSTDKKMLMIFLTPTLNLNTPIENTVTFVNAIDETVTSFDEAHPEVKIGITGGHVITRDEMESGMEDTVKNVIVAFVLILIVFVLSFRMFTGPLLAMIVLMAGISWDMGITALVLGRLNIMTAMCSVVLMGLGVDFAIHILSAYSEFRHKGMTVEEAMKEAFMRIGTGLLTGALTTSCAFLALMTTSYSAFREFGFVVGAGIITCLLASLFFLTSAIILKEKIWAKITKNKPQKRIDMEFKVFGSITKGLTAKPWISVGAFIVITIFLGFYLNDVYMNSNYMDMEPEGLESVRLQREIPKRFNTSADNMVAIIDDLDEVNRLTDVLNERPAIGFVESISDFLPSTAKQNARIPEIQKISDAQNNLPRLKNIDEEKLIEQLYRFSDNITEMSSLAYLSGLDRVFDKTNIFLGLDEEGEQVGQNRVLEVIDSIKNNGDSGDYFDRYQSTFRDQMRSKVSRMANYEPLTAENIPDDIRERFISEDGSKYLLFVYSKKDIWEGLLTTPFLYTVLQDIPTASGMPVLIKAMIETAKEEGIFALIVTFAAFFVILLIDFRSLKIAIAAALPLVFAMLWMIGIMGFFSIPFTIVNFIGLPLILGIGIDDGVHIIHRYRIEGKKKLPYTISSIGKAIFLTSMTTMLGFGSLIPSSYRGYASLGILVTLGIGMCFIASVFLLPPLLRILKVE